MTDPHHHTSHYNERCGRKAELFATKECGNHHISPSLELTIDLDHDAVHEDRLGAKSAVFSASPSSHGVPACFMDVSGGSTGTAVMA